MTRDTDGSPKGRDAPRLDGAAATAGAGTASREHTPITPQQADREAAADYFDLRGAKIPAFNIRSGNTEDVFGVHSLVQAFAHHAQQARLEERERCAKVAFAEQVDADATGEELDRVYNRACADIAFSIRGEAA